MRSAFVLKINFALLAISGTCWGASPIAVPDEYAVVQDTTLTIVAPGLLVNDIDPDGDAVIVSNFLPPSHGTLLSIVTNGSFVYEPDPGFTGVDSFSYTAQDATDAYSQTTTVTIHVLEDPNRPPLALADHYATLADTTLTIAAPGLLANDFDPDGDAVIVSNFLPPSHGTLTSIVTNGSFVYEPDPGFTGVDSFIYTAYDANEAYSEPTMVEIRVGETPTLTLLKEVVNDEVGSALPGDFVLVVTGSDGTHDNGKDYTTGDAFDLHAGVEYTVSELPVTGYVLRSIDCRNTDNDVIGADGRFVPELGDHVTCTLTNDDITYATFRVTKDFLDDNVASVEVSLTCNTGLPLVQHFTLSEGESVNFVVDGFAQGEPECEVVETPIPGYSASYDNGDVVDSQSCKFDGVVQGQNSACNISNSPDPVDVVIDVAWLFGNESAGNVSRAFDLELRCMDLAAVESTTPPADVSTSSNETRVHWTGAGDGSFTAALVPTYPESSCEVTQVPADSAVETDNACGSFTISAGDGHSCSIVNTIFFEGIPSLNHRGIAALILLLLGFGLLAVRRIS
jgi:hypothetical protein